MNKQNLLSSRKFLVLISGGFLIATVLLSIFASVKGSELVDLERKIATLESDNREMTEKIISKNSLSGAAAVADQLGFGSQQSVIYLNRDTAVAGLH